MTLPKIQNWTLEIADINTVYLTCRFNSYTFDLIAEPNGSTLKMYKSGKLMKKLPLTITLQDFLLRYKESQQVLQDLIDSVK